MINSRAVVFSYALIAPTILAAGVVSLCGGSRADTLPIIDAHNQFDKHVQISDIICSICLMDKAGVARTMLSARGMVPLAKVAAAAEAQPGRLIAAIRTKGGIYSKNKPEY